MSFFFGQKHPRLMHPRYSTITGFCPKTGYIQRIARGRTAGCGVVQHANETRQSAAIQAQAQCVQHAVIQARYSAGTGATWYCVPVSRSPGRPRADAPNGFKHYRRVGLPSDAPPGCAHYGLLRYTRRRPQSPRNRRPQHPLPARPSAVQPAISVSVLSKWWDLAALSTRW
jgi:hypothetical protein